MTKQITTINLRTDIKKYCQDNKINLSEWINTEFYAKFLSANARIKNITNLKNQIEKEEKILKQIKERQDAIQKSLTNREIRYITSIKARENKGFKIKEMLKFYNYEFKRNITQEELTELINLYEKAAEDRIQRVANKQHKKPQKLLNTRNNNNTHTHYN